MVTIFKVTFNESGKIYLGLTSLDVYDKIKCLTYTKNCFKDPDNVVEILHIFEIDAKDKEIVNTYREYAKDIDKDVLTPQRRPRYKNEKCWNDYLKVIKAKKKRYYINKKNKISSLE